MELNAEEWDIVVRAVDFAAGGSDEAADVYVKLLAVDAGLGAVHKVRIERVV